VAAFAYTPDALLLLLRRGQLLPPLGRRPLLGNPTWLRSRVGLRSRRCSCASCGPRDGPDSCSCVPGLRTPARCRGFGRKHRRHHRRAHGAACCRVRRRQRQAAAGAAQVVGGAGAFQRQPPASSGAALGLQDGNKAGEVRRAAVAVGGAAPQAGGFALVKLLHVSGSGWAGGWGGAGERNTGGRNTVCNRTKRGGRLRGAALPGTRCPPQGAEQALRPRWAAVGAPRQPATGQGGRTAWPRQHSAGSGAAYVIGIRRHAVVALTGTGRGGGPHGLLSVVLSQLLLAVRACRCAYAEARSSGNLSRRSQAQSWGQTRRHRAGWPCKGATRQAAKPS
jgi:hypothetical protein